MIGLIALAILIVCIVGLVVLSRFVTKSLPIPAGWKTLLRVLIVVGAFPLSVADEIIGKYQFEALCKANGIESADVSSAKGRRVKAEIEFDKRLPVAGPLLPTKDEVVTYRDAETEEALIRYKNYYSEGGWLMRHTWISMGSTGPMLFRGNGCGFAKRDRLFSDYQIFTIN